ncbi:DUF4430 domain-containing protein [Pseudogracilibacillus sp. SO30301A]|uniref:DUF4430 domain-containing protein n=1 Tax=Pseudogracilibacillus sp. SO30301A TaxID=3098291 RepID=UPI00300E1D6B
MKKWMLSLFTIFSALILAVGCSNDPATPTQEESTEATPETTEVQEEVITVTISKDEGEEVLSEKEIAIEENDILMDVMKENYDIEEDNGFITSIDGVAPEEGEEKAWMYFVNDEMAMVGAAEYELKAGYKIVFDLQAWE